MIQVENIRFRYITDENGKRKEIILPIKEFEKLIEDLEDLAIAAERRDETTISHNNLIKQLKKDDLL